MNRVMVYIDGFNLYFGLRDRGWKRYYWLDLELLAQNLLRPGQQLELVKYFTARIRSKPNNVAKRKRQAAFLEAVATRTRVKSYFGHYLPKSQNCRKCGSVWETDEEKMTDVNIAVELLRDAYEDSFDTALLISADSDLVPPVRAVLSRFPQKRVIAVAPPERQSRHLESAASACLRLGRGKVAHSQFPERITKPDGFVLERPASWC